MAKKDLFQRGHERREARLAQTQAGRAPTGGLAKSDVGGRAVGGLAKTGLGGGRISGLAKSDG